MKFIAFILTFVMFTLSAHAQTYEIGAFLGGANYIGDIGRSTYIAPKTTAIGGILKWNRSTRHAFRVSMIFSSIEANDSDATDERRQERGYSFENRLIEASIGLEYNFWDFNIYDGHVASTPYLYTGVTVAQHDEHFKSGNEIIAYDSINTFAIPMVVGYKIIFSNNVLLGMEIGARYTFTDNLDGSDPGGPLDSSKFGDISNNDWYVFTGITLTIGMVRKPCYCNF